jgi:hypothetical protein
VPDDNFNAELLKSLNEYSLGVSRFSEVEREISKIMELDVFVDVNNWQEMITERHSVFELASKVRTTFSFLPKFLRLIEQDNVEIMKHDLSKAPPEFQGKALLTVIILEEKGVYSSPKRIIETLEAIDLIYDSVAILNEERTEQKMILLACDSGSDKSFDFLGLAKLVEMVKEIILSLWDRVVFFREKQMGERIDLIAKSLPVIERIVEMEKLNHLAPEQAEILRRNIVSGVEKFIQAGAIIPEVESHSRYNPRQLMAPEPKLLAMPTTSVSQHSESHTPSNTSKVDHLSPEAKAEFERLFKEMMSKSGHNPSGGAAGS